MIEKNNNWTKVITSKKKWFDFNFKEISDYRDLIFVLVRRDLVSIYKQTVLGPVWFLFGPIFTIFTYTFAFNKIANISTDGLPAPIFYLAGTILWNYFQACFGGASSTFASNVHLFGKVYFPRIIPSLSSVISNLLKLGIQFIVFCVFCIFYYNSGEIHPNIYMLFFPLLIITMAMMGLGIGLLISSITIKYRDVNQLIGAFMTLLMYATPIIYPTSAVPPFLKPYLSLNPIAPIINLFRYSFTGAGQLDLFGLYYSIAFSFITLFCGVILFNRVEKNFIDTF